MRGLGYPQELDQTAWYQHYSQPVESDMDLITVAYYSPAANYPPQRIGNYQLKLAEHQTLNGVGMSRMVGMQRAFTTLMMPEGAPVKQSSAMLRPRYAAPWFSRAMRR